MTMTAEQIVDRRRLRRKLSFWRVIAFLVALVAIVGGLAAIGGNDTVPFLSTPQIARVTVSGFITEDRDTTTMLDRIANDPAVKGVVVAIDSTGGATSGGEALYEGLRKIAAKKPTVATISTFGASAAYMAAIATDHIVARRTSITGSIGVIFQYPQISELLKKIGVDVVDIKSAPLKAEPNPFTPPSPEATRVVQGLVKDTFDWFVDIVAERRNLPRQAVVSLADGRIYTGRQALGARLIDEIGGEETALGWLGTKGVDAKLPVKDWAPRKSRGGILSYANAALLWVVQQVGIGPGILPSSVIDRVLPESLKLDGLLSVWQGSSGTGK
jgi:protease-4